MNDLIQSIIANEINKEKEFALQKQNQISRFNALNRQAEIIRANAYKKLAAGLPPSSPEEASIMASLRETNEMNYLQGK